MLLRYHHLRAAPVVFRALTGLAVTAFDALVATLLPTYRAAERARLDGRARRRAPGAGRKHALPPRDQVLLAVVWLRRYPTNLVLGYLFGVSEYVALRAVARVVPLLETAGLDTMRLPDPGKWQRPHLDDLLRDTPGLRLLHLHGQVSARRRDPATTTTAPHRRRVRDSRGRNGDAGGCTRPPAIRR